MSTDEFTKLFKYMTERFDHIDKALEEKADRADVNRIIGAIDGLAKRVEIKDEERIVMAHQLGQLDQWVHQLAEKIGVELPV